MKKLALCVITLAAAIAQAATGVTVTLTSPMTVGGTQLKAGDYKVQVQGNTATFTGENKKAISVPATTVTGAEKYKYTSMEATGTTLKAIHLSGTDTTIQFATTTAAN
jgi:hypothetical protein